MDGDEQSDHEEIDKENLIPMVQLRPGTIIEYGVNSYYVAEELGVGTFGRAFRVWDRLRDVQRAIKIMYSHLNEGGVLAAETRAFKAIHAAKQRGELIPILNMHTMFPHEFVCPGESESRNFHCIVLDILGPSLYDVLNANNWSPFPRDHVAHIGKQLLQACQFLHERAKIVHLDIKPENVAYLTRRYRTRTTKEGEQYRVVSSPIVKLFDFNSSARLEPGMMMNYMVQTLSYRAPEVIIGAHFDHSVDIFAVGAVLFEIARGCTLFAAHTDAEVLYSQTRVIGGTPVHIMKEARNSQNPACAVAAHTFTTDEVIGRDGWPTVCLCFPGMGKEDSYVMPDSLKSLRKLSGYFDPHDTYDVELHKAIYAMMIPNRDLRPSATSLLRMRIFSQNTLRELTAADMEKIEEEWHRPLADELLQEHAHRGSLSLIDPNLNA